ncbi:TraB/GumN family protein [Patiriisocius marinistellae]|uniref:TraB/GumN family protein n=1 Tax=Patiriisocius marinistellae TaxID=2494560 RepID=A0A5J4FS89_9FLAO|nr:TraB/GumN family protein [Patiriisocius marinistellae]GEQ84767.1 TraB/GumN family protein [Patiriisocius marinistellae]
MKNLKNILALVAFIFAISTTTAQENEHSLLWKVEGNGIKTSYVFGTFHMLPKEDFALKDKVKNAFTESENIFLELDMDDPSLQQEMMQLSILPDGGNLKNFMDESEYSLIDTYLLSNMGVGLDNLATFKPLMVSTMVMMGYMGKDVASYEATLISLAKEQQKEINGLETVASQIAVFDIQPYDEQMDEVVKLLKEEDAMKDMFNKMIELYKAENIEGLYDYMDEFYGDDPEQLHRMLDNRNQNWIPLIVENSKKASTFYGVGAGHLGGEQGVISLLKKEGFTVTPVIE